VYEGFSRATSSGRLYRPLLNASTTLHAACQMNVADYGAAVASMPVAVHAVLEGDVWSGEILGSTNLSVSLVDRYGQRLRDVRGRGAMLTKAWIDFTEPSSDELYVVRDSWRRIVPATGSATPLFLRYVHI